MGLEVTNILLDHIKDKHLLLFLENNIRSGISTILGYRYLQSNIIRQILYIDAKTLYGWPMSQYLPTCEVKQIDDNIPQQIQLILNTPVESDCRYFIKYNVEYPAEIKLTTEDFLLCPYQTQACKDCFSEYMNSVKQPNYNPTTKLT